MGAGTGVQVPWRLEAPDPPESELEVAVSCQTWVLGTEFRSSRRALHFLTYRVISLAPLYKFNKHYFSDSGLNKCVY